MQTDAVQITMDISRKQAIESDHDLGKHSEPQVICSQCMNPPLTNVDHQLKNIIRFIRSNVSEQNALGDLKNFISQQREQVEKEYFIRLVFASGKKDSIIIRAKSGDSACSKLMKMRQLPGVKIDHIEEVHAV